MEDKNKIWADASTAFRRFFGVSENEIQMMTEELSKSIVLHEMYKTIENVDSFSGKKFTDFRQFHFYRAMLYFIVRSQKPTCVVETGTLHGFSSVFILDALRMNGTGRLISIDLPHHDGGYLDQGTALLPSGKEPGWAIPDLVRGHYELHLGDAKVLLPEALERENGIDFFIHDSDHSYDHMQWEMQTVWPRLADNGILVADNIEQNDAFDDFVRDLSIDSSDKIYSYPQGHPEFWVHGLARKTAR